MVSAFVDTAHCAELRKHLFHTVPSNHLVFLVENPDARVEEAKPLARLLWLRKQTCIRILARKICQVLLE